MIDGWGILDFGLRILDLSPALRAKRIEQHFRRAATTAARGASYREIQNSDCRTYSESSIQAMKASGPPRL